MKNSKDKKDINLRELTTDELKARFEESKDKLFHLRFGHKTTPLKNPLEIRYLRRQIARILTIVKEKSAKG